MHRILSLARRSTKGSLLRKEPAVYAGVRRAAWTGEAPGPAPEPIPGIHLCYWLANLVQRPPPGPNVIAMKRLPSASGLLFAGVLACTCLCAQDVVTPRTPEHTQTPAKEPTKLNPTNSLVASLSLPPGFEIAKFADGLMAPRMMAAGPKGALYVTRRHPYNDVVMLKDLDGDGLADTRQQVASIRNIHGIAIRGNRIYLAAIRDFYVGDIAADGSIANLKTLYSDLPEAGQHPNRTVRISPAGRILLSVGSTQNAAPEPNPENATLLELAPDGSGRETYAKGLRDTVGFDWHPQTSELWGVDRGIESSGELEQREELNRLVAGGDYGWPFVYDDLKFNPDQNPKPSTGMTWEQYAPRTAAPMLGLEPHSAPMDLLFYRGSQFPPAYRNSAFVALHGSVSRQQPVGYKVVLIRFEKGQPTAVQDFLTGFLANDGKAQFGRPCGMAVDDDGTLYLSDDGGGVIYRITYTPRYSIQSRASSLASD